MPVAALATGAAGGVATVPTVKVTVLSVAFLSIWVRGTLVFAPAQDRELGVEVSEKVFLPVPVHAQVEEFMVP